MRIPDNSLATVALFWTLQGMHKRGKTKKNIVEICQDTVQLTWETASKQAKDRQKWGSLVEARCAT